LDKELKELFDAPAYTPTLGKCPDLLGKLTQ